jgi:hypothetical protein
MKYLSLTLISVEITSRHMGIPVRMFEGRMSGWRLWRSVCLTTKTESGAMEGEQAKFTHPVKVN